MTWRSCFSSGRTYHSYHSYGHQHHHSGHHKGGHHYIYGHSAYGKHHCGSYQYGQHGHGYHKHTSHIILIKPKYHGSWCHWEYKNGCCIAKPPKDDNTPPNKPLPENGNITQPPVLIGEDGEPIVVTMQPFNPQTDINTYGPPFRDDLTRAVVNGTPDDDTLTGNEAANHINGLDGNDFLYGLEHIDLIYGGNGDDYLEGNDGNDYLNGGLGNDTMVGGNGNDQYLVTDIGDVVIETNHPDGGIDTVYSSIDYTAPDNVENITLLGEAHLNATGNELDNILIGNAGNNTLNGLAGNDILYGGEGNDTYLFNKGYGQDMIYEYDNQNNDHDVIQFGSGIRASDLDLSRHGDNLIISVAGSDDSLTVNNWFKHSGYQLEELVFTDSSVSFSAEQINNAFARYAANTNISIDLENLTNQTLTIC